MDLLRSLEQLQDAVDMVLGRITKRVAMEHDRLHDLSKRIGAAKEKVDAISRTKQAITVFSTTKYPQIPSEALDFSPLFGENLGERLPAFKVELNASNWQEDENEGTLELFRFFLETSQERLSIVTKDKSGIGAVPSDAKSVADVLLFNSTDLPYDQYKVSANLQSVRQPSADRETFSMLDTLPPPPQSLIRGSNLMAPELEEYGFKPTLREVPLFTLPSRLPDLPMVADISWAGSRTGAAEISSIAPSAANKNLQKSKVTTDKNTTTKQENVIPLSPSSSLKAPPSSTKSPSTPKKISSPSTPREYDKGKEKVSVPPPPPPLPSSPAPFKVPALSMPSSSMSPPLPPIDTGRAALLASIRSPNIKLRKTEEGSEKQPDQSHDSKQQPAGLLAEMATTLKMRRLSMKGATHDVSRIPTSPAIRSSDRSPLPITNLQAFIPQTANSDEDDDDWEE